MQQGLVTEIDWGYLGALLANKGDEEQAKFLKAFVKECLSWGTTYQAEIQFASVNQKLNDKEKELLSMIGYQDEEDT